MERVVIKIGGSLISSQGEEVLDYIHGLSSILASLNNYSLALVVGGGETARKYVSLARELGLSVYDQDILGIEATRLNAKLLAGFIPRAWPNVPRTVDEAGEIVELGYIPVMGGTVPGHTTNTVAALLAEAIGARLVNLTNVDGIYDKDPREHPDAKKFDRMSYEQLIKLAAMYDSREARAHFVFDLLASKIVARSGIELHIVDGRDLETVKKAILGEEHNGTVVSE